MCLVGALRGQGACTMYTLSCVDRGLEVGERAVGVGGGYILAPWPPSGI